MDSVGSNPTAGTLNLAEAVTLAAQAHDGQKRKGSGDPYIVHPVRVLLSLSARRIGLNEDMLIAAVLHDVVEDCGVTLDDLRGKGASERVIQLVDRLTRKEGERYADFIRRIRQDSEASMIKIEDILDNLDDLDSQPGLEHLRERYTRALEVLI